MVRAAPDLREFDHLRIGVKAFEERRQNRFSVSGSELQWELESGNMIGRIEKELPGAPIILITLSYRGELLHRWFVRDQSRSYNARFDLHRAIDPLDNFRNTFFEHHNDF